MKDRNDGAIVNLVEQSLDTSTGQPRADITLCGLQNITHESELWALVEKMYEAVDDFYARKRHTLRKEREARHAAKA